MAGFLIPPIAVVPDEAPEARTTELRTLDFPMATRSRSTACELSPSLKSLAFAGCVGSYNNRAHLRLRAWELPIRHRLQYPPSNERRRGRRSRGSTPQSGGRWPSSDYSPPYTRGIHRLTSLVDRIPPSPCSADTTAKRPPVLSVRGFPSPHLRRHLATARHLETGSRLVGRETGGWYLRGSLSLLDGTPSSRWISDAVIWDAESPPAMGASASLLVTGIWGTVDGISANRRTGCAMWTAISPPPASRRFFFILFLARRDAAADLLVSARCNVDRPTGIYARAPAAEERGYLESPCTRGGRTRRLRAGRDRPGRTPLLPRRHGTWRTTRCGRGEASPLLRMGGTSDMVNVDRLRQIGRAESGNTVRAQLQSPPPPCDSEISREERHRVPFTWRPRDAVNLSRQSISRWVCKRIDACSVVSVRAGRFPSATRPANGKPAAISGRL